MLEKLVRYYEIEISIVRRPRCGAVDESQALSSHGTPGAIAFKRLRVSGKNPSSCALWFDTSKP